MRLSILIADAYDVVRPGIRTLLERRWEWNVCGEAATGSETLEKVRTLHPDLVLLGVTLPDMDTAEVISGIMAVCPTIKIAALAMPGSGELAARALAAGASGLAMTSDAASDLIAMAKNLGCSKPCLSPAAVTLSQGQPAKNITSGAVPNDLTPRELEILKLLANGRTNKKVAQSLDISVRTVDVHRTNIMRKLKFVTYSELVQFAIRHKLIEI